jgi:hypothetical protein
MTADQIKEVKEIVQSLQDITITLKEVVNSLTEVVMTHLKAA